MAKTTQVTSLFLIGHMGLIFFFYPSQIIEGAESSHWILIMAGFLFYFAIIGVYMKGISYFENLNVIQILQQLGKLLATILLLPLAVYLVSVSIVTFRAYADVIRLIFLTSTPIWAILLLLVAISSYIAFLGVEAIFRTSILLIILGTPLVLFVLASAFQNVDWQYLFPLLDKEVINFSFLFTPAFAKSFLAFGGGFLYLGFIQPYVTYKPSKMLRAYFILLPMFLISVYIPVLTFGRNTAVLFSFPFLETAETIEINWLMFDRTSMFFLICLISFVMLFHAMLLWKTALIIRVAIPVKQATMLIPLAILVYSLSALIPDWHAVDRLFWMNTILRVYAMLFIPVLMLFLGIRHSKKVGVKT
ncbi:GerAB/ArcD/ProY family transporter [Paenibacillus sp. YIM B09110]|uniref:GerAB/ArcD/ProY family transporter n=1 Tax=Paenibacillus sp. YIM B09110 TaxID=3126102 RepID=UPI00301E407B